MTKGTDSETEAEMLDAILKARIEESFADPRPSIPHEEVVAALKAHHAARLPHCETPPRPPSSPANA